jgi:glutathione S-transferase
MTPDLTLHYAPDNASLCVRLLLEEMGTPYRTELVNRSVRAQKSESYLKINPNGLIPTLETPNGPIFETAAILLWLADQAPGTVFPTTNDPARGPALATLFWLSNTLHQSLRFLFYADQYVPDAVNALRTQTRLRLGHQFTQVNQTWDTSPDPLLACYLAPLLRWPALYGGDTAWFDLSKYPNLESFAKAFEDRSAVHQACIAEGLGQTPFSAPHLPNPPEGSAT